MSSWAPMRRQRRSAPGMALLFAVTIYVAAVATAGAAATNGPASPTDSTAKKGAGLKNTTGAGHYYGGGYGDHYGGGEGYGHHNHHRGGYGGGGDYGYQQHHLVDDYICDFDASILVVTNSKRYGDKGYGGKDNGYGSGENYGKKEGGYGNDNGYGSGGGGYGGGDNGYGNNGGYGGGVGHEGGGGYGHHHKGGDYGHHNEGGYSGNHAIAHRLRCSVVAIRNDSDCQTCCQLAARRDRSISKERIIGFIVDDDQIRHKENDEDNRKKRQAVSPPRTARNIGSDAAQATPASPPSSQNDWAPSPMLSSGDLWSPSLSPPNGKIGNKSAGQGSSGGSAEDGYAPHRPHILPYPPYNPRCVCCAPKHHYDNNNVYGNGYGNHYQHYGNGGGGGGNNYENHGDYGHHHGGSGYGHHGGGGGEYGNHGGYGNSHGSNGGYNKKESTYIYGQK